MVIACWMHFQSWKTVCQCVFMNGMSLAARACWPWLIETQHQYWYNHCRKVNGLVELYDSISACITSCRFAKVDSPMIENPSFVTLEHSSCVYCKTTWSSQSLAAVLQQQCRLREFWFVYVLTINQKNWYRGKNMSGITLLSRNPLPYLTFNHAECVWGCSLTSSTCHIMVNVGRGGALWGLFAK